MGSADLRAALDAGDIAAAAALLDPLGKSIPADLLALAAELRCRQERWAEAVRLLNRQINPDPASQMQKCFARNMAALQQHRPDIYAAVLAAPDGDYQPIVTDLGLPTILHREPGRPPTILSSGPDPRIELRHAMSQLAKTRETGEVIGVWGLGDGYVLKALADDPPPLLMTQQQCVHVIIPDASHLRAALKIHDYTPAPPSPGMRSAESPGYSAALQRSPITESRFRWFVGPDWFNQFRAAILREPDLGYPRLFVTHGRTGETIAQQLTPLERELSEILALLKTDVEAHARTLTAAGLAELLGENPPRPPRILFFTSRFTTVLQHSTRDAAAAFTELGFEPRIIIESTDHHTVSGRAILDAIATFRPDIIFMIDHLRGEVGPLIPPQIPVICWVQDHLPNLTNRRAGATVTARDFILTGLGPMYRDYWAYPARQLIDLSSLTRVPQRPATWTADGDDLAYVSNGPLPVPQLVAAALENTKPQPHLRPVVDRCCNELLRIYEKGGSIATLYDMGRLVDRIAAEHRIVFTDPPQRAAVVNMLMHPLNNALYRQQALRWVIDAARDLGLRFSLYGRGWDNLREFAELARGPVAYGPPLEELTRRTRINLQIVPWFCLHPRLLDGLVAGGFFLVRRNPTDALLPEFAAFLAKYLPDDVQTIDQARRAIDPSQRAAFEDLMRRAACLGDLGHNVDIVEWVRCCRRTEILDDTGVPLPHYDDVVFDDSAGLRDRIARFIADSPARQAIAKAQRKSIEHRLSYTAGLRRATRQIASLLADEAAKV